MAYFGLVVASKSQQIATNTAGAVCVLEYLETASKLWPLLGLFKVLANLISDWLLRDGVPLDIILMRNSPTRIGPDDGKRQTANEL